MSLDHTHWIFTCLPVGWFHLCKSISFSSWTKSDTRENQHVFKIFNPPNVGPGRTFLQLSGNHLCKYNLRLLVRLVHQGHLSWGGVTCFTTRCVLAAASPHWREWTRGRPRSDCSHAETEGRELRVLFYDHHKCDIAPAQWYFPLCVSVRVCQLWKDRCLVAACVGSLWTHWTISGALTPSRSWNKGWSVSSGIRVHISTIWWDEQFYKFRWGPVTL